MSDMRKDVVAIVVSDIHLSHVAPFARSDEKNWYDAQLCPLEQLKQMVKMYDVPLCYAGDIFDRSNPPPELINFAIKNLPWGYSVPGQHDLPLHNFRDREKSAYMTLVHAGILRDVSNGWAHDARGMLIYGMPWGGELPDHLPEGDNTLLIAHAHCWEPGSTFHGSLQKNHVDQWVKRIKGFSAAAFGDNHKGFVKKNIINCGTLMRRHANEVSYSPTIGMLLTSGGWARHRLNCSSDVFVDSDILDDTVSEKIDLSEMIDELKDAADQGLDFPQLVQQIMRKRRVRGSVERLCLRALGAK